jgi:hypothetical protein
MLLSPEEEAKAKQRFMVINALRMGGVLMVLIAIAIVNGAIDVQPEVGYGLAVLGMVEVFVIPQVLARMWSSNRR